VTEADTALFALNLGLKAVADLLSTQEPPPHTTILLLTSAGSAASHALDASPHDNQPTSLQCLEHIDGILLNRPELRIRVGWLPKAAPFIGCKRARQLALEAARTGTLDPENDPHSIGSQKQGSKQAAVAAWADQWHKDPHTSLVYRIALTQPPDGQPHATFLNPADLPIQVPRIPTRTPQTTGARRYPKLSFSRKTFSTMYRIITGHAFIGAYTERFFPLHTPEQIACPCGEPTQTVEHVLLHCPIHEEARHKHLTINGRTRGIQQLFKNPKRVLDVLKFLEETGACAKPRAEWEPG
jgi:hypothetical protein